MPLSVSFDYNFNEIPPLADGEYSSSVKLTSYMQNDKRRISMPPRDCSAVEVRRLRYVVGRSSKAKVILSGINMTVPEGAIYGLLGPSGSGKTTLLKSVVGQLTPSEGWVKVFGFQPNQPGSQIPGAAIGYMPQELAVYEDFTIKETLWYFGRLYRIPSKVIKERIEFLLTFLDLPRSKRLIFNMSGGQKRRVSLASALVHSPPLLILDEPTAGVDPLLRQSIWQHLVTLTQTEKITVIITTHYIEEARRANIVGLMRRGKLLAENSPEDLMAKHDSTSLEDVFLKLCISDTMRRAQKFASLTGIPVQAAIAGTNSVIPTPEIESKRAHNGSMNKNDDNNDKSMDKRRAFSGSNTDSQSPDEGVNTAASGTGSSSSNSSSSGDLVQVTTTGTKIISNTNDDNNQIEESSLSISPVNPPSSDGTVVIETKDNGQQQQQYILDLQSPVALDSANVIAASNMKKRKHQTAKDQQQQQPTKGVLGFQLKSLLNFSSSKNSTNQQQQRTGQTGANSDTNFQADGEKRRQSGTHFVEQLLSKYQQDQQHRSMASINCENGKLAINQLLSCDTATNGNGISDSNSRHSQCSNSNNNNEIDQNDIEGGKQSASKHDNNKHLNVPKISIHGFGDSGASSNSSSQNQSPNNRDSTDHHHLHHHHHNGYHEQQLSGDSNNNNQLITASYNNHSYQPSESGSVLNELALITAVMANEDAARQINNSNNGNNNNSSTTKCDPLSASTKGLPHHQATVYDNGLDDDVMLDPELFLNPADLSTMSPGNKYDYKTQSVLEYCSTIGTITWKNYIRLKRNVPLLLFQFVLPAIQVILFCICVGNDPFDIPVAVVNEESSADSVAALSSQFLRSVDKHLVRQVNFSDLNSAIESVRDGKNWGVIHIPENFTISVHTRFSGLETEIDDATLENSTIKVYPDMTNQPIGHAMEVAFRRAYSDLSKQTFEFLGLNPALTDPPIRMEHAVYGKVDMQNYLQYMSPGVLISISYIMATGLTSLAFIIERRDGLYDRTLAAGVHHVQMLLSHSIVQLVVMVVQISLVVFFTFVIYKVPTNGPFIWVFLLLLLQGLAGMSFGLMVSAICKEENTAIMMILGTFYPNLLLAGVIWPIEAIPYWLRWFSYLQPQTLPTQSLRDLIVRGWDIDQPGVWSGFVVTTVWLLLFLAISCLAFRIKK